MPVFLNRRYTHTDFWHPNRYYTVNIPTYTQHSIPFILWTFVFRIWFEFYSTQYQYNYILDILYVCAHTHSLFLCYEFYGTKWTYFLSSDMNENKSNHKPNQTKYKPNCEYTYIQIYEVFVQILM